MSKFLTGTKLGDAIYDIIWDANESLLIVSPFVKLDDYFKKLFDKHINNPKLHFLILFGKNEKQVSRSMSKADFDFFKKFLNVSIIYVPNLHAKYYGNESKGVITSINLYDYSFKNNIEFGVYSEGSFLDNFTKSADNEAWDTSYQIASDNEAVFIKRPVYQKKLLSTITGKNYVKSDVLLDVTDKFYLNTFSNPSKSKMRKLDDFLSELDLDSTISKRPEREDIKNVELGFCIRTKARIPFNIRRPYSENAYKSWACYSNWDFPEKYCHRTGVESKGRTNMKKPVLN